VHLPPEFIEMIPFEAKNDERGELTQADGGQGAFDSPALQLLLGKGVIQSLHTQAGGICSWIVEICRDSNQAIDFIHIETRLEPEVKSYHIGDSVLLVIEISRIVLF